MGFGKKHKAVEDETPGEEVVETLIEDVVLETPAEEVAPEPKCYAPGEGSMNHAF